MQTTMAMTMSAPALSPAILCNNIQIRGAHLTSLSSLTKSKQKLVYRWRAMAADPYVDYNSSPKSVFPAEACDTVGGESCEGKIGTEVQLKSESSSTQTSPQAEGIDREYVEYNSIPKTVFPGEACDDLGGEFCEPEYQSGVFKEKEPSK
ncbi:hypothetical protein SUGI_0948760 [Cryptomeria japonica]|uniref:light-regulated protein 1, chloroplastic n=1 Tax=Cryptomeria japonica TaxID=3369 RepID=UPI002414B423|nr:light-regulated protein 1, chloroplastic [Cryptomeria japonica]GLJ45071.1 hypothetical protein SUGI_0948760 [Cryptomeria japonica]